MKHIILQRTAITCALICASFMGFAQSSPTQDKTKKPDNSAQNQDQNQGKTADNQPDSKADRSTTAAVRRAIIADKDLSTYAHNIKIITTNGTVTLKGPVKSEEEKQKVLKDAQSAVSQTVVDELTVKQ
jgi:hyperosmotically inducible periplasmic protein